MVDFSFKDPVIPIEEFKSALKSGEKFEGLSSLRSAKFKIHQLVPAIILCQHSGTYVERFIEKKMAITRHERNYEEDLYLDELFDAQPITFFATHSRYQFDTNRAEEKAIYLSSEDSWEVEVYKILLDESDKKYILRLYHEFYSYINCLISVLIEHFGGCVVYDFHSFNASYPSRQYRQLPAFNLGTLAGNHKKYRRVMDHWLSELNHIDIEGVTGGAKENDVFGGRGGMARHVSDKFKKAVIFPTEIKKFFMDEKTYQLYPERWGPLKIQINQAILNNSAFFIKDQKLKNRL
jgi:hypothetical protein